MKNAMQLKAIIRNLAKEKHISAKFYSEGWFFDCGNGWS